MTLALMEIQLFLILTLSSQWSMLGPHPLTTFQYLWEFLPSDTDHMEENSLYGTSSLSRGRCQAVLWHVR